MCKIYTLGDLCNATYMIHNKLINVTHCKRLDQLLICEAVLYVASRNSYPIELQGVMKLQLRTMINDNDMQG